MNIERAKQILNSHDTIEVLYNGDPVWIKGLNPDQQTAVVASAVHGQPDNTVSLSSLSER